MKKISLHSSLIHLVVLIILLVSFMTTGCFFNRAKSTDKDQTKLQAVAQAKVKKRAEDPRFKSYADGTILDRKTNLMWAAKDNGSNITWAEAKAYCKNYNGGEYTDWRVPTRDELKGLYDRLIVGNNGYHLTRMITLSGCFLWSSETNQADGIVFGFTYGLQYDDPKSSDRRNRVIPVRIFTGEKQEVVAVRAEVPAAPQEIIVAPPPPPPKVEEPVVVVIPIAEPVAVRVEPPAAPIVVVPQPRNVLLEKVSIALKVEFDTAEFIVKKQYHGDIEKVAVFMREYPDTSAVIEGHTDNVDVFNNKNNNIRLSQERADSIRQYLIDKFGIDATRITAVGYGPNKPIASNATEKGRQKNRRVQAVIEAIKIK